jgi:hypothetical protein
MTQYPFIDFFLIGGNKCGTTWLHEVLAEHHQLNLSKNKEPHFFTKNLYKGADWYAANWKKDKKGELKGESSTSYLYAPHALNKIRANYPTAKIIILLREPFSRALSHLKHVARVGDESMAKLIEKHPSIIGNSLYSQHLEVVFEIFERKNVLLLFFEDIEQEPEALLKKIFSFLLVDPSQLSENLCKVVGKGFEPKIRSFEKMRTILYYEFKKIGFYQGIHWVKKIGLSDLYRKWNAQKEDTYNAYKALLPFKNQIMKDLDATLSISGISEEEYKRIAGWKKD